MDSDMASVYVHLSGRDVDHALLELHGLSSPQKRFEKLELKICPRCQEHNSPDTTCCKRCAYPLDVEAMEWENERMNRLLRIPQVSRYLKRMVRSTAMRG